MNTRAAPPLIALLLILPLSACALMAPKPLEGDALRAATTPDLMEHMTWTRLRAYDNSESYRYDLRTELLARLNPPATPAERGYILNGEVTEGMTTQMVRIAWGEPEHRWQQETAGAVQEIWNYASDSGLSASASYREVFFSGNRVTWVARNTFTHR